MMIGRAEERDGLYYLNVLETPDIINKQKLTLLFEHLQSTTEDLIRLHHYRLGHPSFTTLVVIFPFLFKGFENKHFVCEIYELAKHKRSVFPLINKRSLVPFEFIHSDIWDPAPIRSLSGVRWFVTFIDDCTRVTWLFLLKSKSEVSIVLPTFLSMIKTQFSVQIKRFCSNNARDYFNHTL